MTDSVNLLLQSIFDLAQLNQFLQISPILLNLTNFYKLVIILVDYIDRLQILMANYGVVQPSQSRSPDRASHLQTLLVNDNRDRQKF